MLGICSCCGTKISVLGVWDDDPTETPDTARPAAGANGHKPGFEIPAAAKAGLERTPE
jgi:hypothetical protein